MSNAKKTGRTKFTATAVAIPQGTPVKVDGSGNILAMTAATEDMLGAALYDIAASAEGVVDCVGVVDCIVDGSGTAIKAGDLLMGAAGKLVAYSAAGSNVACARALGASTLDGSIIPVEVLANPQA